MVAVDTVQIPNRSLFRQPEVCEIAQVQPYVLRSWEAEFPDLGVAKTAGGPRVYRRADLERVLRIKHLLFVEGLTLAGARRRLADEDPASHGEETPLDDLLTSDARERIRSVRQSLRELAVMLAKAPGATIESSDFELVAAPSRVRRSPAVKVKPAAAAKAKKSKKK